MGQGMHSWAAGAPDAHPLSRRRLLRELENGGLEHAELRRVLGELRPADLLAPVDLVRLLLSPPLNLLCPQMLSLITLLKNIS